jgi:hypothetical protein
LVLSHLRSIRHYTPNADVDALLNNQLIPSLNSGVYDKIKLPAEE